MALVEGAAGILLAVVIAYYARVKKHAEKGLAVVVAGALTIWLSEALRMFPNNILGQDLSPVGSALGSVADVVALIGVVVVVIGLVQAVLAQFRK